MRRGICLALMLAGCDGLFEENPQFGTEGDETATTGLMSSTSTDAENTVSTSSGSTGSESGSSGSLNSTGTSDGSSGSGMPPAECTEPDIYEPNDERALDQTLSFAAGDPVVTLTANISTATDQDWFKFGIGQTGALEPVPTVQANASETLEFCYLVECNTDIEVTIECVVGEPTEIDQIMGCCAEDQVTLSFDCETGDTNGFGYLRVRTAEPIDACVPYELQLSG